MNTLSTLNLWRQRVAYGMADFACNLIWQVITLYLMFFYTDVAGLAAAQVGTLFMVTRLVDGVADVSMGFAIDKTRTRWGKSRPWLLWGAIPYGLLATAAFYIPSLGPDGKLAYAYATYLGLSLVYTVVNIPLASILPSLTADSHERTVLATSRIIFSFLGATAVSICTLPMTKHFGGSNAADGYFWTMLIFSVTGAAIFIFSFFNVRETVPTQQESVSVLSALSALKGNGPAIIFAVNIIFMWGAYFFQQGAMIYFFTYYMNRPDLVSVIAGISAFVPIVGTFSTPLFDRFFYKRTTYMISSAINLLGILCMILSGKQVSFIIAGSVIAAMGFGLRQSIYFSMQADPVDYGEWKSGVSAAGVLSSINGFIGKVAMAAAGAVSGWMLTLSHYVPNQTQTETALLAIRLNYLFIPFGMIVISMVVMSFYNLDKIYPQIRREIDARNRKPVIESDLVS